MYPRGTPDLGWDDLLYAALVSLLPAREQRAQAAAAAAFGGISLPCLSVRSGFDLVLQALQLPRGTEVLVSAITIPDMVTILEHHGLIAVPIDLDPDQLEMDLHALEAAITPRTGAILVAHIFGARMSLDAVADVAHRHKLLFFEDAAQAYCCDNYRGHPAADTAMFSFGPIKTATALGGAILCFRDPALRARVAALQAAYPRQSRWAYLRRVLQFCGLKALARSALLGPFNAWCRLRGLDTDGVLSSAVRGFPGSDLLTKIRRRPSSALLRVLARRVRHPDPQRIMRRMAYAEQITAQLPAQMRVGTRATNHTHWIVPLRSREPKRLTELLRAQGFDATQRASTIRVVAAPDGFAEATQAQQLLDQLVYLPTEGAVSTRGRKQLSQILTTYADFKVV